MSSLRYWYIRLYFLLINFSLFIDVYFSAAIYIPIAYIIALWGLTRDFKNNIIIQRDAKNEELEKIIEEVVALKE